MSGFASLLVPAELAEAVSDEAWLRALLAAERALASAEARAGVIPAAAASAIAQRCRSGAFATAELAERGRASANPVVPLVQELRAAVGGDAAGWVHWGATSQDIMDTAAMLVCRRGLGLVIERLEAAAGACAALARAQRASVMPGRTLLQQAVPITFGLKAAGWLVALHEARRRLLELRAHRLAAQLGGAAGTLAALGDEGEAVLALYARELELAEPVLPWHGNRLRIAEVAAGLDAAAGAAAKVALDVTLLAQTEVGEAAEAGGGGSSTMPQKRNPAGSTLALACARHAHAQAALLGGGLAQEHERAAGAWQAEWSALSALVAWAGAAFEAVAGVLGGLELDGERMRRNLELAGGLVMAEAAVFLLAPRLGRAEAQELVAAAAGRAAAAGGTLRRELVADVRSGLSAGEIDAALAPEAYLGSADRFVERALAFHQSELERPA